MEDEVQELHRIIEYQQLQLEELVNPQDKEENARKMFLRDEYDDLNSKYALLYQQHQTLKAQVIQLECETIAAKRKHQTTIENLRTTTTTLEEQQQLLHEKLEIIQTLHTQNHSQTQQLQTLTTLHQNLTHDYQTLEDKQQILQAQVKFFKATTTQKEQADEVICTLTRSLGQVRVQSKEERENHEQLRQEYQVQKETMTATTRRLEAKVKDLLRLVHAKEKPTPTTTQATQTLDDTALQLQQQNSELLLQLASKDQQLYTLTKALQQEDLQTQIYHQQQQTFEKTIRKQLVTIQQQKLQLKEDAKQLEKIKTERQDQDQAILEWKKQTQQAITKRKEYSDKAIMWFKRVRSLERELQTSVVEKEKWKTQVSHSNFRSAKCLDALRKYSVENKSLTFQVGQITEKLEKVLRTLRGSRQVQELHIIEAQDLRHELQKEKDMRLELFQKCCHVKHQLLRLRQAAAASDRQVCALSQTNAVLRCAVEELAREN